MKNRITASTVSFVLLMALVPTASANPPIPTGATPTLYGGHGLHPDTVVLGVTTGYPRTSFDVYVGLTDLFDFGAHFALTYGWRLSGNRQGVGMNLHVPLRLTLIDETRWAGGLRISPYFMIGDGSPAIATGADVGFLFDIALPQIFKIIVGPEIRSGFATVGGSGSRVRAYDGGAWANIGVESLIADRIHAGASFNAGAQWGRLGVDGIFRALFYFGIRL